MYIKLSDEFCSQFRFNCQNGRQSNTQNALENIVLFCSDNSSIVKTSSNGQYSSIKSIFVNWTSIFPNDFVCLFTVWSIWVALIWRSSRSSFRSCERRPAEGRKWRVRWRRCPPGSNDPNRLELEGRRRCRRDRPIPQSVFRQHTTRINRKVQRKPLNGIT